MPGPIEVAGGSREPTEYATLSMDTQFTGAWSQRNPLRDADVPYLMRKFYSASRFDSILDGANREITARLTDARRPGSAVYNSNTFPAANSFYSYKWVRNGVEQLVVLEDGVDGVIYNATAGQQSTVFSKSAGASAARFLGVNTELFITDGVDLKKWLQSSLGWTALTQFSQGNFIIDDAGNVQVASPALNASIADIEVIAGPTNPPNPQTTYVMVVTFAASVLQPPVGTGVSFAGVTTFTWANSKTLDVVSSPNLDANQIAFDATTYGSTYANAADTGNATLEVPSLTPGTGTTGSSAPSFASTVGDYVLDGTIVWTCYGPNIQDWMPAAPSGAPQLTPQAGCRYWQPTTALGLWYACFDNNQNIQVINAQPGGALSGINQPNWNSTLAGLTNDGGYQWINCGPQGAWSPGAQMQYAQCILDSNGNLQLATVPGTVGDTQPTWATGLGDTTTDNGVTWTCAGPGIPWASGTVQYAASFYTVDGSVTAASSVAYIPNGVLGDGRGYQIQAQVTTSSDPQITRVRLWRTAQGQPTLIFDQDAINPSPGTPTTVTILDTLPDTSVTGGPALNPLVIAPVAGAGSPPPAGMTAPAFHMGRVWGIVNNLVVYSDGPDVNFNGNTSFDPLSQAVFPALAKRLLPITVSNGGLLVFTSSGVQIILGTGTATNPFYATMYEPSVNLGGYNALDVLGATPYFMEANGKVSSFDPQNGYTEIGFPIGDQFKNVTMGGANGDGTGLAVTGSQQLTPATPSAAGAGQVWTDPADATSQSSYASVGPIPASPPVSVPSGQQLAWAFPTSSSTPDPSFSLPLGCLGSGGAYSGTAVATLHGGQLALTGSGSTCENRVSCAWANFAMPELPNDAVIQAIIPVVIATGCETDVLHELNWTSSAGSGGTGDLALGCPYTNEQVNGSSLGDTSTVLTSAQITFSLGQTTGGHGYPDYSNISFIALAVYYTTSAGTGNTGAAGIQTLTLANNSGTGYAIPATASVIGVRVQLSHGLASGTTEQLQAQLAIAGTPTGAVKPISQGAWPTAIELGGQSDAWGASLTGSQVNGPNGLQVLISGYASGDATVQLNKAVVTVFWSAKMTYTPASAFLTWNLQSSGETAMYVADGAVGWFRMAPIAPPENGLCWSPPAGIVGGTSAVQSIETSPGYFDLLIGPQSSGPILKRDTTGTVWNDNGSAFPAWDAKGVIRLCESGEVAEVAHIALKSIATGGPRPQVAILMDEIAPTTAAPWDNLILTTTDPPNLSRSVTMYSDRYSALQGGITPKGDCLLLKVDYGANSYGDELLMFSIYGKKQEERVQQ